MAVKLVYTDIALGAAENAEITVTTAESFSQPELLPFGTMTGAVATLEPNGWGLSHTYKVKDNQPFALWTKEMSDTEGNFETPPEIILDFSEKYTSTGLTLRFSPEANEYCREISVVWYQGDTLKERGEFFPTSALLEIENTVESFDKIVITLKSTNLPLKRAKLEYIAIGIVRELDGRELTQTSFICEANLISDTLPINVLDANFHSKSDAEYLFQKKQPVEAYNDTELIGVYYIETGERTGERDYSISCQDAIGTLENETFGGGLWLEAVPLQTMLEEVVGGLFDYEIAEELSDVTLRGYIEEGTKRQALQQIAFAAGCVIDTAGTKKIKVFVPKTADAKEISDKETYIDGKITTADTKTGVTVTAFDITDEALGEKDEKIEFNGKEYKCVVTEYTADNPNVTAGMFENKVVFDKCYLCNSTNAQTRADAILDYYMRRNVYSAAFVMHGETTGDFVNIAQPWGDRVSGNITKMSIRVSGITVCDAEILLE